MIVAGTLPVAEALALAARIADADDADCEALLHRHGPEVCAALRCEVATVTRERDEARDATREMLAALEAPEPVWDADESEHDAHAARLTVALDAVRAMLAGGALVGVDLLRRDLPAIAVVVCPACGVDITADLDDDGAYVTRRHSRREPARVGLGGIVWCDGGLVAP